MTEMMAVVTGIMPVQN